MVIKPREGQLSYTAHFVNRMSTVEWWGNALSLTRAAFRRETKEGSRDSLHHSLVVAVFIVFHLKNKSVTPTVVCCMYCLVRWTTAQQFIFISLDWIGRRRGKAVDCCDNLDNVTIPAGNYSRQWCYHFKWSFVQSAAPSILSCIWSFKIK